MVRIASYNVENLFARPKALDVADWSTGRPILAAYEEVNELLTRAVYTPEIKARIVELLVQLDIYYRNAEGAVRRRETQDPVWAWLRKNRGDFDLQPKDKSEDVEIIATGRDSWIGWVELSKESVDEVATRMTARVIKEVDADIITVVEAEDRPALVRFNRDLLGGHYGHVMLIDGNDDRGIDVGVMTKTPFETGTLRSNVDLADDHGIVFSRDCPQYQVYAPSGACVHVLANHFKSQSGGGGEKRARQARAVRNIAQQLVEQGEHVVVLGDLNEGPKVEGQPAENLAELFDVAGPLVSCYSLAHFDTGPRPGTFDSCGLGNRLDYVLISKSLQPAFRGGGVFRKGLWGSRKTRPTAWETYPEIAGREQQASDHAAVYVDLDL